MRKFYSNLLLMLLVAIGFSTNSLANEASFKFKVPVEEISNIEVFASDEADNEFTPAVDRENGLISLTVTYTDDCMAYVGFSYFGEKHFSDLVDATGASAMNDDIYGFMDPYGMGSYMAIVTDDFDGAVFEFKFSDVTVDTDVYFNIDDASKVSVLTSNWEEKEIVTGNQTLSFSSAVDFPLMITRPNGIGGLAEGDVDMGIYQVKLNGEPLKDDGAGSWSVTPQHQDKIDVITKWPDETVTLTVNLPEGCESFIKSFAINDEIQSELPDFSQPVEMKIGSSFVISFNKNDYELLSLTVDGNVPEYFSPQYSSSYGFQLRSNSVVDIDCKKLAQIKFKVINKTPDKSKLYKGTSSYYSENLIELAAGEEKEIEMSSNAAALCWELEKEYKGEYYIEPTRNGEIIYEKNFQGEITEKFAKSTKDIADGDVFVIEAKEIVRDETLYALAYDIDEFFEQYPAEEGGFYLLQYGDYTEIKGIHQGYNEVPVNSIMDNPIHFQCTIPGKDISLYLNEETVIASYGVDVKVVDGDVLKIYTTIVPQTFTATFTAETLGADELEVKKDMVIPVIDWSAGVSGLTGTLVSFSINKEEGYDYNVTVNGDEMNSTMDGIYSVTLEENQNIVITKTTGVETLNNGEVENSDVYNMQGVCVLRNATKADINNLPKGVYFFNGKKVVK